MAGNLLPRGEKARRDSTWLDVLKSYHVLRESTTEESDSGGTEQKATGDMLDGCSNGLNQAATRRGPPTILKRQVIIIDNAMLRRMEREFSMGHKDNRMLYCHPGAKIKERSAKLVAIMKSPGKPPLVMIHIGTNAIASSGTT